MVITDTTNYFPGPMHYVVKGGHRIIIEIYTHHIECFMLLLVLFHISRFSLTSDVNMHLFKWPTALVGIDTIFIPVFSSVKNNNDFEKEPTPTLL